MDTTMPAAEAAEDRTVAIISYLTLVGFIIAIVMHSGRKTRVGAFHLRQVLGLVLTGIAGGVVGMVPILGWIAWFVVLAGSVVLWFLGLLAAVRGEMRPVPLLGEHYQRWFAGTFD